MIEYDGVPPQGVGVGVEVTRQGNPVNLTTLGTSALKLTPFPKVREPIRLQKDEEVRVLMNLTRYLDLSVPEDTYQIVATWRGSVVGNEKPIADT